MDDGEAERVRTDSFAEHNRSRLSHFRSGRVESPSPITGGPPKQHFTSDVIRSLDLIRRLCLPKTPPDSSRVASGCYLPCPWTPQRRSTGMLLILWDRRPRMMFGRHSLRRPRSAHFHRTANKYLQGCNLGFVAWGFCLLRPNIHPILIPNTPRRSTKCQQKP